MRFGPNSQAIRSIAAICREDNQPISDNIQHQWSNGGIQRQNRRETIIQLLCTRIAPNLVKMQKDTLAPKRILKLAGDSGENGKPYLTMINFVVVCTAADEASPPGQSSMHLEGLFLEQFAKKYLNTAISER